MAGHTHRFKIRAVAEPSPRKRVPSVNAPAFAGDRRRVLSAQPTGEVVWHDWNNFESARLNQTIAAKVAAEKQFLSQYRKPKPK